MIFSRFIRKFVLFAILLEKLLSVNVGFAILSCGRVSYLAAHFNLIYFYVNNTKKLLLCKRLDYQVDKG